MPLDKKIAQDRTRGSTALVWRVAATWSSLLAALSSDPIPATGLDSQATLMVPNNLALKFRWEAQGLVSTLVYIVSARYVRR
jgi:hypothetical protein